MSYEKFITDFLNIEPQRLQKCISSTSEDGEITVRIRLKPQNVNCPYCNNTSKLQLEVAHFLKIKLRKFYRVHSRIDHPAFCSLEFF